MHQPSQITIGIISDHELFRKGLSNLLQMCGYPETSLLQCSNLEQLYRDVALPNVMLLQVKEKMIDDVPNVVSNLKGRYPSARLVMLVNQEDRNLIEQLGKTTADGILDIASEPESFKKAIDIVLSGRRFYLGYVAPAKINFLGE